MIKIVSAKSFIKRIEAIEYLIPIMVIAGISFVFVFNEILFETLIGIFTIIAGVMIFSLAIISFEYGRNYFLLFIGCAFMSVAIIDFINLLIFLDIIPTVIESRKNISTQMWIAGRFIEGFSLFLMPFLLERKFNYKRVIFGFLFIAGIFYFSILGAHVFPTCYKSTDEFTAQKIISEIIIVGFLTGASILFVKRKKDINKKRYILIIISLIIMIISELSLGFIANIPSSLNWLGNVLRIVSHYIIFIVFVVNGIRRPYIELSKSYDLTLDGWAKALELREKETEGHSIRVPKMTLLIAKEVGMNEKMLVDVYRGALLHDIGKIGIPDSILLKPGPLTDNERLVIEKHVKYAYDLLAPIPYLKEALEIPYCHHEKWDGTGYPRGLKGFEIPLSARIFAIADVFDALASDRPYRSAWPIEKVNKYIEEQAGTHFDPEIIKIFQKLKDEGKIIDMLDIDS